MADFRDPWSDWDILEKLQTGKLAMSQHRSLERKVLKHSDAAVTVSKRLALALNEKYPAKRKVEVIMNGVSIPNVVESKNALIAEEVSKFVIGYFGMLNELRNPETLWKGLEELCEQNSEFGEKLEIRLGGIISGSIVARLQKSVHLKDKVNLLGYLSHEEVFEHYKKCNILLLLLNKTDNAKWILPVKFFEYLTAQKPILTLGPLDSDLGDILQMHNVGKMLSGDNVNDLSEFILSTFAGVYQPESKDFGKLLEKHSRENQAKELDALIKEL